MMQNPTASKVPYLIVGLGNPGQRYAHTRHNAGFMVLGELAQRHGLRFTQGQGNAETAKGTIEGTPVLLARPQTFMNNSGRSVSALLHFYKIPLTRLLVVYDDIDLPVGTIRIREKGSAGGHNGLKSIIQHIGTQNFARLRIGVDRPTPGQHNQIDWVLGHFDKDEQQAMQEVLPRAAEAIGVVLCDGIERAMNIYNSKDATGDGKQQARPGPQQPVAEQPATEQVKAAPRKNSWAERVRNILREEMSGE